MGAKYLPTIKDLKATQRFNEKQMREARKSKDAGVQPAKKSVPKKDGK
jgi:hypothetical protein